VPHIIAWCGFLGAWLLVAGPLDQAVREISVAFLTIKDILNAWLYVAAGAALIGVKETWELHEAYEWLEWTFFTLIVLMVVLCVGATVIRARHRQARPAVEG
jgi:hypothetical protein